MYICSSLTSICIPDLTDIPFGCLHDQRSNGRDYTVFDLSVCSLSVCKSVCFSVHVRLAASFNLACDFCLVTLTQLTPDDAGRIVLSEIPCF